MPATFLGLMLMVCPKACALPLPGVVLEVRTQASDWHWCMRAEADGGWRVCEEDWKPRTRAHIEQVLHRLRTTSGLPASSADGAPALA